MPACAASVASRITDGIGPKLGWRSETRQGGSRALKWMRLALYPDPSAAIDGEQMEMEMEMES